MAELRFEPVYPKHAIERCVWTLNFAPALPEKVYANLASLAIAAGEKEGFTKAPVQGIAFSIDHATGHVRQGNASELMPIALVTPDNGFQFSFNPATLAFQTDRYVRWEPFFALLNSWPLEIVKKALEVVSIATVQLEYYDRFMWSGDWSDIRPQELLNFESGLIAQRQLTYGNAWHNHVGWFERSDAAPRTLVNVNMDAVDFLRPPLGIKPSISVLTLMQHQFILDPGNVVQLSADDLQQTTQSLHLGLKTLLGDIISKEMQARIALFGEPNGRHS